MSEEGKAVYPEPGDTPFSFVSLIAAGWMVFVLSIMGGLYLLSCRLDTLPPPPEQYFPSPRLVTRPQMAATQYFVTQKKILTGRAEIKTMSINEAMTRILRRSDPYAPITGPASP